MHILRAFQKCSCRFLAFVKKVMGYFRFFYTAQPFYSKFPDVKNESARATKLEGVGRGRASNATQTCLGLKKYESIVGKKEFISK